MVSRLQSYGVTEETFPIKKEHTFAIFTVVQNSKTVVTLITGMNGNDPLTLVSKLTFTTSANVYLSII